MRSRAGCAFGLAAALLVTAGCGTTKVTGTARTATEQLLLTNAWDDALRRVDFRPLAGVPVYFDPQYLHSAIDQGWMVSSIRQAMLAQGVLLRAKPEQAQWIVEGRVGTYGTNDSNWMFGIPQTTIPAVPGLTTAASLPEMALAKKNRQQGVAKLALYAYDRSTGQVTWTSGAQIATSNSKDVYIGGLGPIHSDSTRPDAEIAGVRLPALPLPDSAAARLPAPPKGTGPASVPRFIPPPATIDQDSFAP